MVRTQIQLEEKQVNILKKLAASRHTSMAEVIRQAVDSYAKEAMAESDPQRRQRAMRAAGRFCSGTRNLATDHDAHLAEIYEQ